MSAQVEIALKDPSDEKTVAVISCAPSNALVPQDAPTQQISDSRAIQVNPRVNVNGVGAEGLCYTRESKVESSVKQDWAFHSSKLKVNTSEFSWRRKSLGDDSGLDRFYDGASVLRRADHVAVALEAFVRIQAQKYIGTGAGGRQCGSIGLDSGEKISKAAFNKLTGRYSLQQDILTRNHGSAPTCKIQGDLLATFADKLTGSPNSIPASVETTGLEKVATIRIPTDGAENKGQGKSQEYEFAANTTGRSTFS